MRFGNSFDVGASSPIELDAILFLKTIFMQSMEIVHLNDAIPPGSCIDRHVAGALVLQKGTVLIVFSRMPGVRGLLVGKLTLHACG